MALRFDVLFIVSTFTPGSFPGADNPDRIPPSHKGYHHDALRRRMADDELASFRVRVIRIVEDSRERIREYGRRLLKSNAVLRKIGSSLGRVPLEDDAQSKPRYHASGFTS